MLSSVLRSKRAVLVNIEIMRAFVRMRQILTTHADLARKLESLEKKYDAQFSLRRHSRTHDPAAGTATRQVRLRQSGPGLNELPWSGIRPRERWLLGKSKGAAAQI